MSKTMLVNVTHVEESRVAIVEDGVLAQYEIETINRTNIKGNIYNAVVENVHPALDAAFLRIAPDLKGFLPLDEVNFKLLPTRTEDRRQGRIGQHLHAGQKLMVQVVREPFAGKPPTVTTYFSLPGRFLVLMPGVDSAGVSRKIEDGEQRDRLKKMVDELSPPEGFGLIVRTAGLGQSKTELQRDLKYLLRLWESIQRGSRGAEFPGLVYRERDLVIRTIRDYFTSEIAEVWIDNPDAYEKALEFVRDVMPTKAKAVKLYTGDRLLFGKFNLEEQIESIYKRRVPLRSGGEIVIDGTEALTAIDVNSARASRQGDAEDNALQTNLDAAAEIARQLRLRDLGGLVVIDFIDMQAARNKKKVEKAMRDAMKTDRAKHDVTTLSKLGLMEIARQRIKGEKMGASYATCPVCEGYGLVKNVEPAALAALRKLQARCLRSDFGRIRMGVPPDVANWLLNNKREDLVQLERRHAIKIVVDPKGSLLRHESEFEFFPREKVEVPPALVAGDRPAPPAPPDLKDLEAATPPSESEVGPREDGNPAEAPETGGNGGGRKRRRRRRRRGRGAAAVAGESQGPIGDAPRSDGAPSGDADADADSAYDEPDDDGEGFEGADDDEASDVPGPDGAPVAAGAVDGDGRKRRRRRRRRRRGRGRGPGFPESPEGGTPESPGGDPASRIPAPAPAPPPRAEADEIVVPKHIRAEELMPAATGGRRSRRREAEPAFRSARPRRRRPGPDGTLSGPAAAPEGDPNGGGGEGDDGA